MLFTFDLVLIDKHFKVVGLKELLRPFRVTRPNFRAESVLELPAHAIIKSRTEVGDQLVIERYEAKKAEPCMIRWKRWLPLQFREIARSVVETGSRPATGANSGWGLRGWAGV